MDDILKIVKQLLGISETDTSKDAILLLHIDIAGHAILNFCSLKEIPDDLKYVWAQLAIGTYEESTGTPNINTGVIKSMSEGEGKVEFGTSAASEIASLAADKVTQMQQLYMCRRLYR